MANAILTTKIDHTYDDLSEERYHFPRTYLRQIETAKGVLVIYYKPRRATATYRVNGKPTSRPRALSR